MPDDKLSCIINIYIFIHRTQIYVYSYEVIIIGLRSFIAHPKILIFCVFTPTKLNDAYVLMYTFIYIRIHHYHDCYHSYQRPKEFRICDLCAHDLLLVIPPSPSLPLNLYLTPSFLLFLPDFSPLNT